jgi:aryl-alcohol dehydrogenase-like predicted oxidoreductase
MDMQYGRLPGIEKPISRLVQGTVMIGTDHLEQSFKLLDDVFALGCNIFDTGHLYGNGDCERTLGQWIEARGLRDELVVFTKGAHFNADRNRVTPFDITSDLFDSLARLRTDKIDLYMLHRDDPTVAVGPIVEVLNEHKEAGRICAIGGSNWTHERIQEANAYAEAHDLTPFVASSPQFSLAEQVNEPWPDCVSISGPAGEAARAWYQGTGMALFTWSSLAGGFFSGRFTRDNLDSFTADLDVRCVNAYCHEDNFRRFERAAQLAEKKGLSMPQIALAYVMNQPLNIFALVGCANGDEFVANLAALEVQLTPEEVAWLDLRQDEVPD